MKALKYGDLVWFKWRGYLCLSPVLKVNRDTVTVAVSAGRRRMPKTRVSRDSKGVS